MFRGRAKQLLIKLPGDLQGELRFASMACRLTPTRSQGLREGARARCGCRVPDARCTHRTTRQAQGVAPTSPPPQRPRTHRRCCARTAATAPAPGAPGTRRRVLQAHAALVLLLLLLLRRLRLRRRLIGLISRHACPTRRKRLLPAGPGGVRGLPARPLGAGHGRRLRRLQDFHRCGARTHVGMRAMRTHRAAPLIAPR